MHCVDLLLWLLYIFGIFNDFCSKIGSKLSIYLQKYVKNGFIFKSVNQFFFNTVHNLITFSPPVFVKILLYFLHFLLKCFFFQHMPGFFWFSIDLNKKKCGAGGFLGIFNDFCSKSIYLSPKLRKKWLYL